MNNKITCTIKKIEKNINSHKHTHGHLIIPFNSFVFIETEELNLIIDQTLIGFVPPNIYHKYNSNSDDNVLIIDIPSNMIKKSDLDNLSNNNLTMIDGNLMQIIDLIKTETTLNPNSESIKYLFFFLYDKIVEQKRYPSIDFISSNYSDEISISLLASMEHYNTNYYPEWFRKQTGMTPQNYIQKTRIDKAKELLVTTNYNIDSIANQVGYDYTSSFCRAFKSIEGQSPSKYRSMYK